MFSKIKLATMAVLVLALLQVAAVVPVSKITAFDTLRCATEMYVMIDSETRDHGLLFNDAAKIVIFERMSRNTARLRRAL